MIKTESPSPKSQAPGKTDTSGSLSDDGGSKESSNVATTSSRKSNKKKRADHNRLRFRGAEERLNEYVYQVDRESGKRPNQYKKTTNQIW